MKNSNWLLLGASRGLGLAFFQEILRNESYSSGMILSRRPLQEKLPDLWRHQPADLSKIQSLEECLNQDCMNLFNRIIYFAAGGPYGSFESKNWKDHVWAWHVSFMSFAYTLHRFIQLSQSDLVKRQVIVIGSSVAQDKPDPYAASYCAAKHALVGLVSSVQLEISKNERLSQILDIRIFPAPYMDTQMLPPQAEPRLNGTKIFSTREIAESLYSWCKSSREIT